ncbi:hypothetical protein CYLTODRAFT_409061 [Cylindrobasidium torrendii FP15055 ss-10]|uniref:MYND-type domain-containing protein n=1 Tax=Cylindrobasidium torrendii FP15055 ss-10 TaxID=1314674 RepID=A0A0D7BI73_9AGAR|nr:hypothetical protein CYLTODRAFT_409061 [Cylindrobasidium torrendii FP15055 ss-10]
MPAPGTIEVHMDLRNPPPMYFVQGPVSIVTAGQLCAYCAKPSMTGLQKCSGCHRVKYCSKECQKKDWPYIHKTMCKQWKQINELNKAIPMFWPGFGPNDDRTQRQNAYKIRREQARRTCGPLSKAFELSLLIALLNSDEIKCANCWKTPFETEKYAGLKHTCSECRFAWWCSDECYSVKETFHPADVCQGIGQRAALQHLDVAVSVGRRKMLTSLQVPTLQTVKKHTPLSSLSGWDEYAAILDPSFSTRIASLAQTYAQIHGDVDKALRTMAFDHKAIPMTILATLEELYPDIATRQKLKVHLIGAGPREATIDEEMESILHFLPALKELHVAYIGPRIENVMLSAVIDSACTRPPKDAACHHCQAQGRGFFRYRHTEFYHDYVNEAAASNGAASPDLCVLINSGFSEEATATWLTTLDWLIAKGKAPILCTQFTITEAKKEQAYFDGREDVQVLTRMEKNKWGSPRDILRQDERVITDGTAGRNSHYRLVVQGKK